MATPLFLFEHQAMKKESGTVVKLNREQMMEGKNSFGSGIGNYAFQGYADYKYKLSSLAGQGNVDLYVSGDFQKGMFALVAKDGEHYVYRVGSLDPKTGKLVMEYGLNIFGLTPVNFQKESYNVTREFGRLTKNYLSK